MFQALFRGRQIFKFGLLRKNNNKKNLKIRIVFNRMVCAHFQPYCSYTKPLAFIKKTEYETNNFIDFDISAISNKLSE
jgi:hypothetical protein